MALSLLQQQLTVAALAFSSGLLMGLAVYRGEIGRLGRSRRSADFAPAGPALSATAPRRPRKRKPFKVSTLRRAVVEALGDLDPALKWVLAALGLLLAASAAITRLAE